MSNREPQRIESNKSAPRGGRLDTKRSSVALAQRLGTDQSSATLRGDFATPGYQSTTALGLQPLSKIIRQGESSSYMKTRDEMN